MDSAAKEIFPVLLRSDKQQETEFVYKLLLTSYREERNKSRAESAN